MAMKESSLVKRYARALVLAVGSEEEFARVRRELAAFLDLLARDPRLRLGLTTALVSQGERAQAVDIAAAALGLHEKTRQFLKTVAAENRMAYLEAMARHLPEAWCAAHGIEPVEVASAVELSAAQKERLQRNLETALGRPVRPEYRLEPALIAGLRLARGSVHYDFSLAGSLQKLRQAIAGDR
jgi:F-type H+-transporting ATPase subunit delta